MSNMLGEKNQEEIVEFFKETIEKSSAEFCLTDIYCRAKEQKEAMKISSDLIEVARIKSFNVKRELIIDKDNAIFETEKTINNKKEEYSIVVINGNRSCYGYHTLEQGILGWICEKQNCPNAAQYIFKMLDMDDKR